MERATCEQGPGVVPDLFTIFRAPLPSFQTVSKLILSCLYLDTWKLCPCLMLPTHAEVHHEKHFGVKGGIGAWNSVLFDKHPCASRQTWEAGGDSGHAAGAGEAEDPLGAFFLGHIQRITGRSVRNSFGSSSTWKCCFTADLYSNLAVFCCSDEMRNVLQPVWGGGWEGQTDQWQPGGAGQQAGEGSDGELSCSWFCF